MNVNGVEYVFSDPETYRKPENGIPKTDMAAEVQSSLDKADNSVQKVAGKGLSTNDFTNADKELVEQTTPAAILGLQQDVAGKYTKPQAGIPASDMTNAVQALLEKAGTAVQPAALEDVTDLIPQEATAQNKLADKAFVNSSISTATATFQGSYNLVTDLSLSVSASQAQIASALGTAVSVADNNDYAFVQIPTSNATPTEIARVERYKYDGSAWAYEFALNNSGFTAAQWAALNSGITSGLVSKLQAMPTNSELATLLSGKQDVINDLANIRTGSQYNVKFDVQALTNQQKAQARANIGAGTYDKPSDGIPGTDVAKLSMSALPTDGTYTEQQFAQFCSIADLISAIQGDCLFAVVVNNTGTASYDTDYYPLHGHLSSVLSLNSGTLDIYDKDKVITITYAGQGFDLTVTSKTIPEDNVFKAFYGITTLAQITAAHAAEKVVVLVDSDCTYVLSNLTASYAYFGAIAAGNSKYILLSNGSWSRGTLTMENTSNKVTSLSAQSTNTQYPGAKATYDEIHPAVASTQPQGGFLPNVVYDLGVLTGTVTFALATPSDANVPNAYHWTFDTGSTEPTINWPSGVIFPDGVTPTVEASKHYEVLVRNGYGSILVYSLT